MTVLNQAALGRATLARQLLLAPSDRDPIEVIEHLVGLQAQAQLPPYYGLWCRLRDFTPAHLGELIISRSVVRVALMRSTVHLASAADARMLRPLLQPALDRMFNTSVSGRTLAAAGVDLRVLGQAGREALGAGPLTGKELGERLRDRWPTVAGSVLADGVRTAIPLVQVPPRGVWGAGGVVRLAVLDDWAPQPCSATVADARDRTARRAEAAVETPSGHPLEAMIVRYLGAFGPASVADVQAWCGLTRLAEIVDRLRGGLVTFRGESGVELFDLPAAPRPAPQTPAPVRLVAEFDNLTLSHADRTRIISDADRRRMFTRNGIVPGLVLVDGVAQAMWRHVTVRTAATVRIEEFRPLTGRQRTDVEAESRRLLAFAAPAATHDVEFTAAA